MDTLEVIGRNIRAIMERKNIDACRLQELSGYCEWDICRILNGILILDANDINQLADILKVPVDDLIKETI